MGSVLTLSKSKGDDLPADYASGQVLELQYSEIIKTQEDAAAETHDRHTDFGITLPSL